MSTTHAIGVVFTITAVVIVVFVLVPVAVGAVRPQTSRLLVHLVPIKPIQAQEDVCWCGIHHLGDYWHDPTHGRIDRDIQDMVTARYGDRLGLAQREAIESTAQDRRDRGQSK